MIIVYKIPKEIDFLKKKLEQKILVFEIMKLRVK